VAHDQLHAPLHEDRRVGGSFNATVPSTGA
jgi:hypothetical protein